MQATRTNPVTLGDGGSLCQKIMPALEELEEVYLKSKHDREFQAELDHLLATFVGRPTPITYAAWLTEHFGGPGLTLSVEHLVHTGAHKINNALGQALLMKVTR